MFVVLLSTDAFRTFGTIEARSPRLDHVDLRNTNDLSQSSYTGENVSLHAQEYIVGFAMCASKQKTSRTTMERSTCEFVGNWPITSLDGDTPLK